MAAISRVSQATGLKFIYDGATTEAPSFRRDEYQPGRYGDHWVPVLISWATIAENPDFVTNVDGESGSAAVSKNGGPKIFVTGNVELDSSKLTTMLLMPDGNQMVFTVVLHELGHLIGLAHVTDPSQLMYPETGHGITDFAVGDLTGAAILGKGVCAPDL